MKIFCNLNNINKKTIVISEQQAQLLKQLNEKRYHINTDIKNDKEYIYPVKISIDDFKNKLTDIYEKYIENYGGKPTVGNFIHRFCSYWKSTEQYTELKELAKDIKLVNADGENCDVIGDIRTIKNGIPYIIAQKGGDWEIPVLFMIYYDGNNIRAYFPKKGNTINLDDMTAFQGISSERDKNMPYLKKQFPDKTDDELRKISEKLHYNIDLCIKDFEEHIKKGKKIKEEYFRAEELLTESLLFEAELKDIYQKYYNNIPEETFWQIVKADPTYNPQKEQKMGKYGKWLLNLFRQNRLKPEDLYKATDYLTYFNKYYNKIEQKDINQYDSLPTLFNVIKPFKDATDNGEEMATSKSDEIRKIKEDAEKFYEDDTWLVVIPHTQEAACYYGKNTEWCTAATSSYNMFNQYYNDGLLYINICKKTNKKYQFHFESCQFMDENDNSINVPIVSNIPLTQGLIQKYVERYGGKALLLLTKPVDFDNEGDNAIQGEEPYYSYIDYDGYTPIVKTEGLKVQYLNTDELSYENDVVYISNGIFEYKLEEEQRYDSDGDPYPDRENYHVLFDAKTRQTIDQKFRYVSKLNSKYIIGKTIVDNITTEIVYESTTLKPVYQTKPYEHLYTVDYSFRTIKEQLAKYDDNIVISTTNLRSKEERQMFGGFQKKQILNLETAQYIVSPFNKYEIRTILLDDNKYYLIYRSTANFGDGYIPYVIIYPDGSLSETMNESVSKHNLQSIIKEAVRNVLFEQYLNEATLNDIYAKYYSNIPQEEFWQIIKSDPTWSEQNPQKMGKYSKWLLNQYKQGKLKLEDLYKYRESLDIFNRFNNKLNNKDIMAYSDGNALYQAVKQFIDNPEQSTSKSDEIRKTKQDVEKVYEDNEWLILIPKTEEAAKYYGKGTRWCTAADNDNRFNQYNNDGPLFININKQNGEKYQFHFESNQLMDSSDTPISGIVADRIGLSDGAKKYYVSISKGFEVNGVFAQDGWKVSRSEENGYITVYTPYNAPNDKFEIDLNYADIVNGDEDSIEESINKIFPVSVLNILKKQMKPNAFYNCLFGTDTFDYTYEPTSYPNKIIQFIADENKGYIAKLFNINEDFTYTELVDLSKQGFYVDDTHMNRFDGTNLIVFVPETKKKNIYSIGNNNFIFNENVDKIDIKPYSDNFYAINNNNAIIRTNNGETITIPPLSNDLKISNIFNVGNIAVISFGDGVYRLFDSKDTYGFYIINQKRYAFDKPVNSYSEIGEMNDNFVTTNRKGFLTKEKNESSLNSKNVPKEIIMANGLAATYYPQSNLPIVLNDGTVMTRTQYWQSKGVFDTLMQLWSNN